MCLESNKPLLGFRLSICIYAEWHIFEFEFKYDVEQEVDQPVI